MIYLSEATWFELREINYHIWKHSNHEPGLLLSEQVADKSCFTGAKSFGKRVDRAVALKMITAVKQLEFLELVLNKAGFFVPF